MQFGCIEDAPTLLVHQDGTRGERAANCGQNLKDCRLASDEIVRVFRYQFPAAGERQSRGPQLALAKKPESDGY